MFLSLSEMEYLKRGGPVYTPIIRTVIVKSCAHFLASNMRHNNGICPIVVYVCRVRARGTHNHVQQFVLS